MGHNHNFKFNYFWLVSPFIRGWEAIPFNFQKNLIKIYNLQFLVILHLCQNLTHKNCKRLVNLKKKVTGKAHCAKIGLKNLLVFFFTFIEHKHITDSSFIPIHCLKNFSSPHHCSLTGRQIGI